MKRVAFGELYLRLRNDATDQLTQNPAAERSRGSFVPASNRKGLRHVRPGRRAVRAPMAVYVEQVYEYGNFGLLGICPSGTWNMNHE